MSLVGKYLSSLEHFDSLPDTLTDGITTDGENSYVAGIPEAVIKPMENSEQSNESDGTIVNDNQAMNEKKETVEKSEDDGSTTDTETNQGDSTEDTQVESEQETEAEDVSDESENEQTTEDSPEAEDGLDDEESGEDEDESTDVQYSVEHHGSNARNSNQSCSPTPPRNHAMLNVKAYVPSMEEFDDVPSPLIDGDAPAVIDSPIAEPLAPVVAEGEVAPLPIEQVVELPPHLDPTPIQPLEGEVIQEEIIAEHADTEAGQLLGAQIALESYGKLLRSSGNNMTRQSAAFLAVGMRRADRLMPGVSLGLEDENSGTQVMAMQKANVDKEGLGSKIKAMGAKIWEWLKQKYQQLKGLWEKFRAAKKKETTTYLIAAAKAVEKPTEQSIKALPAPPQGVQVAKAMGSDVDVKTVLEAIHGAQKDSRSVQLPGGISGAVTRNGKLDLNFSQEHKLCYEFLHQYLKDGTALLQEAKGILETASADKAVDEIADRLSDAVKKTMAGKASKLELHGFTVTRDADGRVTFDDADDAGQIEVKLPSPQEIGRMLEDKKKAIDEDDDVGMQLATKFMDLGEAMMQSGDRLTAKLGESEVSAIESAVGKVLKDFAIADIMAEIVKRVVRLSTNVDRAADFFLSHHLGKGNTVSQEDYGNLPALAPQHNPGALRRGMNMAKDAWRKLREFMQRLWDQFTAWCQKLWAKIRGTETNTDVLLLTNSAAPDEPGAAPGPAPDLPTGTGMRSVQAVRLLTGPSAASGVPDVVPEPVTPVDTGAPNGMVVLNEALEIALSNGIEVDPIWEETMVTWLIRHYIPTQAKIVRDLTSWAGSSNFDGGITEWMHVIEGSMGQLWQGLPNGNVPGYRTIEPGDGTKIRIRQEGMMGNPPALKPLKRRQIDQALARQKKVLKALGGIEKFRVDAERQRTQLNAMLDRRVAAGVSEEAVTGFYNHMETKIIQSSAAVVAGVITKMCDARNAVFDAMIVVRAKK